ncbi:MAG: alpha/beta hydrolase [Actinomycetota bacterium]|nr:alpha/beta hydrolase [Actinomycetota bacterium]
MATLRLWSDELEAMRPEAREAVAHGMGFFDNASADESKMTQSERVASHRALLASSYVTVPEAEEREIAGVRCRVFRPDGAPVAVYLHFHGGGMMAGAPEMMDYPNREMARTYGVAVISVDYRKAPEHPWPAGPDDGVAVAQWLLENGEKEFGTSRILIGGESAGGYMAAITGLRVRDELGGIDRVEGLNLVFGVYDWGRSPSQRGLRPHDGTDILSVDGIEFFTDCFVPGMTSEERRGPNISPAYADLRGLPPCLMSVGSCDHLLDDTLMLASRAAAAGVDVDLFVAPELPHAFMMVDCGITKLWAAQTHDWFETRLRARR